MLMNIPAGDAAAPDGTPKSTTPSNSSNSNHSFVDAEPLTVGQGTVSGSSYFPNGEAEFSPDVVGHSPVWWMFTSPADGWYHFGAIGTGSRFAVTVVDRDSLEVVASSRWRGDESGDRAIFHGRAGSSHAVSVGVLDGPGGEFVLDWAKVEASAPLRYAGRIIDGDADAHGVPIEIRQPGDIVFGAGKLFLASGLGLSVFERDPATGKLAFVRLVDGYLAGASLAWDEKRSRLIAHDCGHWTAFNVGSDRAAGAALETVAVAGDPAGCGRLLLDAEGNTAYRVGDLGVDAFVIREDGSLRFDSAVPIPGIKGAVLGESGQLYAAAAQVLMEIGRDDRTGQFTATPTGVELSASSSVRVPLAVSADRTRLLAVDSEGAHLFALGPSQAPVRLKHLPMAVVEQPNHNPEISGCSFASIRSTFVVDVVCSGAVVTAPLPDESEGFAGFEQIGGKQADRLSEVVPDFGEPVATVATPDGRHVYVSTLTDGLLLFEGQPGVDNVTDDHGDSRVAATWVSIPSTTAGELSDWDDHDYFHIEIANPGTLTLESTGSTNPIYATLQASDGSSVRFDAYGGEGTNFRIETGVGEDALAAGVYYLWLRGFAATSYELVVSGTARGPATGLPAAAAPAVSINAIAAGDEGTAVSLGATVTGGRYDGALEYAWNVDGGVLSNPSSATPAWTRPAVTADTNYAVRLTVTARGTGTAARNGTSATASAVRQAQVRGVTPQLPAADAPSPSIHSIAAGDENTTVELGASLSGGTYDGSPTYAWTVTGGRLDNPSSATPTWTRPSVSADTGYTVRLTVTVSGTGGAARTGTRDTAATSRTAQVRDTAPPPPPPPTSCVDDGKWDTVVDYYDANATRSPNYGANWFRVLIAYRIEDPERTLPAWEGETAQPTTPYTASEAAAGEAVWSGWTPVREVLDCLEAATPLPAATAPTVAIDAVAAGDEGTTVGLSATLTGGTYDGTPEYDWDVSAGALDDDTSATPSWTRPAVSSNTNHRVSLEVTVHGAGTGARNGTSDTANASRDAQVRDAGGDHGDDRASATPLSIPSTTDAALTRGDRDHFRFDVAQPGTLTLRTTGGTDTYGTLFDGSGQELERDDDGGPGLNFRIPAGMLAAGTYYLEVRGYNSATSGDYRLEASGSARTGAALPAADAPTVAIDAIAAGDEDTAVQLGATLTGGTYDGAPEYAWTVSGGALDDAALATPTWTRPSVNSDTSYTIGLTVTVRGAGTNAQSATSDARTASRSTLVRDAAAPLPAADAPSASINAIAAGAEDAPVQLGATLVGGTYDGPPEYAWTVNGGALDNPASATPTWTRPSVSANANHTVRLTVTVRGTGTAARNGTSDTAQASRTAQVRDNAGDDHGNDRASATPVGIPSTTAGSLTRDDRDYFRIDIAQAGTLNLQTTGATDTYGRLLDGTGRELDRNDDGGEGYNFLVAPGNLAAGTYYLEVRGYDQSTTGDYSLSVTGSARPNASLPVASAPGVSIHNIAAGDKSTAVQLGATLSGGTYDGTPEYAWTATGGTFDNPASATPTWTRPPVTTSGSYEVRLTVTVRGAGINARTGSSDTASATRTAWVRNRNSNSGLVVESPAVSDVAPRTGADLTLSVTVANRGNSSSAAVQLRYYESSDATIENTDAWMAFDQVPALAPGGTSALSATIQAPSQHGVYYYGACIARTNNCSSSVRVDVPDPNAVTAPTISVAPVASGGEATKIELSATVTGGSYEHFSYDWSVRPQGGDFQWLSNEPSPVWIRPYVAANTVYEVRLVTEVWRTGVSGRAQSVSTVSTTVTDLGLEAPTAYTHGDDIVYAGHRNQLHGGETLRLVLLQYPLGDRYDTARFSWSVTSGGGRVAPVPGGSLNDRGVVYQAPANVSSRTQVEVTCTVTYEGNGATARAGHPFTLPERINLTVLPNRTTPVNDRRGPTSERGDEYADGYAFWNGGQAVQITHNPYINTAPGRTITYSFPESSFTRGGRTFTPLLRTLPLAGEESAQQRQYSTEALRDGFRQGFAHWEQYLNVRFREVPNSTSANLLIGRDLGNFHATASTLTSGDTDSQVIAVGASYYTVARTSENEAPLHEIGHALGLGHPHTQGAGANLDDSIMEYAAHGRPLIGHPGRLQFPADIIAAQHIWGAAPGAPRTVPDVPATVTLTYDPVSDTLTATWTDVKINGGTDVTGWTVDWLLDSNPADTNTPRGGGTMERTDTITNASARSATYSAPSSGDWSVQVRAVNAVGVGLRKRSPTTGAGIPVN